MDRTVVSGTPRREREDGRRSRAAILDAAARLATVEGLEGLSIANLAEHTGMSKSGLYAHFKSKQALQLATVDRAGEIFAAEVVEPAHAAGEGLARLWALAEAFISHLERRVFPGGCFFASVGAEFDTHPGRVKERVVGFVEEWMQELLAAARRAHEAGELPAPADPEQVAFEVDALLLMAHAGYVMFGDPAVLDRTRRGVERLLGPRPA
jgi:AcrR family transcriptional regulator